MFGDRVHLFPVRHHSPRASAVLVRLLERMKPARVLVEGPEDAGGVIDVLVDPETRPPVASPSTLDATISANPHTGTTPRPDSVGKNSQ